MQPSNTRKPLPQTVSVSFFSPAIARAFLRVNADGGSRVRVSERATSSVWVKVRVSAAVIGDDGVSVRIMIRVGVCVFVRVSATGAANVAFDVRVRANLRASVRMFKSDIF